MPMGLSRGLPSSRVWTTAADPQRAAHLCAGQEFATGEDAIGNLLRIGGRGGVKRV